MPDVLMSFLSRFAILLLASVLLCWSVSAAAAGKDLPLPTWEAGERGSASILPNNFKGVETWDYPSGLRVFFKSMPHVPNVYISALLPVGSSADPPGREGLAHFVEHMVFTDHLGKSEEEIKQSVLDRGGRKNGITSRYNTRYYVDLPASQWDFGINWLHDLLTRHEFSAEVAEAERRVVMLEKSRRQSGNLEYFDQIQTWLRGHELLVQRDFWEREFGLNREYRSVLGSYASVERIRLRDLQNFYERYYGPQNFTLMIVGNVDRDAVKALVDQTFGSWQKQGETVNPHQRVRKSRGPVQRLAFSKVKNVDHLLRYKLYSPSEYDLEMAQFAARFLRNILNERLRIQLKATYGVSVTVEEFAGHAVLTISGNYANEEMDRVREVIHSTLAELKDGRLEQAEFTSFRSRAVSNLYLNFQSATSIARWCEVSAICDKQIYSGFPDKVAMWQGISPSEFSGWLQLRLVEANQVVEMTKPIPASLVWLEVAGPLAIVLALFYGLHWWWRKPVRMTQIRYMSRIRYPWSLIAVSLGVAAAFGLLVAIVAHEIYVQITIGLSRVDSYLAQRLVHFSLIGAVAALVLTIPAVIPRKLLLFTDGWRVKFWSFRSAVYSYQDVREVRECSFASILLSRRGWTTLFLHWGFFHKGVYIRVGERFGYFLRARDNSELVERFTAMKPTLVHAREEEPLEPALARTLEEFKELKVPEPTVWH
ncbi:insulinase family protein [Proteobacteria bacterium 005FR1]|nr:insulinase family protein [Proteobacteria bacterium 005FR1]